MNRLTERKLAAVASVAGFVRAHVTRLSKVIRGRRPAPLAAALTLAVTVSASLLPSLEPCCVSAVVDAAAQPSPPLLTGPVNDFANVIDDGSERELERRIRALQRASGDAIVVATVASLEGFGDINELALRMFENGGRGVGEKGKDNGALIVLALAERQVRVEVGYDLEEFITDGFAGETIRDVMRPDFRNGQYGRGLLAGVTRFITRVAQRRGIELQDVPRSRPVDGPPRLFTGWPVLVIILILILMSNRGGGRRRRRWGGGPWSGWNSGVGPFGGGFGGFGGGFGGFGGGGFGGGGGGFGGFGGGRSGGGGATGSW